MSYEKDAVILLSIILLLTSLSCGVVSNASEKKHVEDALLSLETQSGYIPGKTASVTYNCFAFVSNVCEKIYGVTYYYEQ
ncbi:MAG: hypothetical protein LUG95_09240 [Clostridiales bacterium]|nr:hypothetical protein [Clostridiales bacterium]